MRKVSIYPTAKLTGAGAALVFSQDQEPALYMDPLSGQSFEVDHGAQLVAAVNAAAGGLISRQWLSTQQQTAGWGGESALIRLNNPASNEEWVDLRVAVEASSRKEAEQSRQAIIEALANPSYTWAKNVGMGQLREKPFVGRRAVIAGGEMVEQPGHGNRATTSEYAFRVLIHTNAIDFTGSQPQVSAKCDFHAARWNEEVALTRAVARVAAEHEREELAQVAAAAAAQASNSSENAGEEWTTVSLDLSAYPDSSKARIAIMDALAKPNAPARKAKKRL